MKSPNLAPSADSQARHTAARYVALWQDNLNAAQFAATKAGFTLGLGLGLGMSRCPQLVFPRPRVPV